MQKYLWTLALGEHVRFMENWMFPPSTPLTLKLRESERERSWARYRCKSRKMFIILRFKAYLSMGRHRQRLEALCWLLSALYRLVVDGRDRHDAREGGLFLFSRPCRWLHQHQSSKRELSYPNEGAHYIPSRWRGRHHRRVILYQQNSKFKIKTNLNGS